MPTGRRAWGEPGSTCHDGAANRARNRSGHHGGWCSRTPGQASLRRERFVGPGTVELDDPPVEPEVDALYAATDIAA